MMGFMPTLLAAATKWGTPNMLPWSVIAKAFIPSLWALPTRFLIWAAPSSSEYWVWQCKWQNWLMEL